MPKSNPSERATRKPRTAPKASTRTQKKTRPVAPETAPETRAGESQTTAAFRETCAADFAAIEARAAAALSLKDTDVHERGYLGTCQQIYERHRGCNSPFEQFFRHLALQVQYGMWPTPDDVMHDWEEFRDNFNDMRRDASVFLETYPAEGRSAPRSASASSTAAPEPLASSEPAPSGEFKIPPPTLFDQLAKTMEKQVDHLTNLKVLVDYFSEFLGKGSPEEITMLMCTLGERIGASGLSLVECMKIYVKRDAVGSKGAAGHAQ